jgi:hypothetical protein
MKTCNQCGADLKEIKGKYTHNELHVGEVTIDSPGHWECTECDSALYPRDVARLLDEARGAKLLELLKQRRVRDFVGEREAAKILGCSLVALRSNQRIKRGFIFKIRCGKHPLYLRESVLQYKNTGDGRFDLVDDGTRDIWS